MHVHDGMLSLYEDSVTVTLCCDDMGILSVNLNYINLDDTNYEKMILIQVRLSAWHNKFEKDKVFKNELNEDLISIKCGIH